MRYRGLALLIVLALITDLIPYLYVEQIGQTPYFQMIMGRPTPEVTWITATIDHRKTVFQPATYTNRIFLFGNSAMVGSHVADNETIASQLQKRLSHTLVENYGQNGADAHTEYLIMQQIGLRSGDTVIFYDLVLDGSVMTPFCTLPIGIAQSYCVAFGARQLKTDLLEREINNSLQIDALARNYAKKQGAIFLHFWQPTIYTMPLTARESQMIDLYEKWQRANSYDDFTFLNEEVAYQTQDIDLLHVLDEARQNGCTCFFDALHTTAKANEIIARAIYQNILLVF